MLSFRKNRNKTIISGEPIVIEWAKTDADKYFNLLSLKPDELGLSEAGGVYIVWYTGVKTTVIYVGVSEDLAVTINSLKDNPEILAYYDKGGIGITWTLVKDKYRNPIVTYLKFAMSPLLPSIAEFDGAFKEEIPLPVTLPFGV